MEIKYQLKSPSQRRSTPYQPTENIGFGRIRTDHMFLMDYADGQWQNPRIIPFGPLPISPGAMALHYGQSIFEGAKAFLHPNDEIYTFRLDKNIERLNASADILCMPHVPADMQKQAIETLIDVERLWFPRQDGACFYIRPFMFATEDNLSVRSANAYTFCVVLSPSGAYYPDGNNSAIRLLVSKTYHRAVSGGTGAAKASGNYAASLRAATAAKEFGAAQVLYLDANNQQIEEAGAMNHFHVRKDGTLIIPTFTDTILKSITSQSVLALGEYLGCEIKQETIMIDDFISDVRSGEIVEAGGFGTAAVVSAVGEYIFEDKTIIQVADGQVGPVTQKLYQLYSDIQNGRCEDPYNWLAQIPRLYK